MHSVQTVQPRNKPYIAHKISRSGDILLVRKDLKLLLLLLYGLPSHEIETLQRLQNTAARLAVCTKKTDHITPVLKKLH